MSELTDQIALVTGGTRGIGWAISQELAEAGSRVAIVDILEEAESAAAKLPGTGHGGFVCDVSDPTECSELIERVEDKLGPVTILVNNAGITRDNILVRLKDTDWDSVIDTNLSGPFYLIRAVARGMMKRRFGKIVNVSSVVGLTGNRGQSNYAAAKAGLIALTKSVAQELGARGVQANAVAPGFIATDLTSGLPEEVQRDMLDRIPAGRLGSPEDVARVVRFLVGPGAAYVTGQVVVVDGGMVM